MAILTVRRRALGAAIAIVAAAAVQGAGAQRGLEYEVKAAFVYNFIKFVEWPAEALPPDAPFRACLLGEDPFGGALERAVRGDTAGGRAIVVERVPADGAVTACQLVFVPRAYAGRTAALARALGTQPVLLVGESDGFLQAGGAINLVVDGGHVRFDVGVAQAGDRRLRISSKLLRVARSTGPDDRERR